KTLAQLSVARLLLVVPEAFRTPVGWLLVPVPAIRAVSMAWASMVDRSERTSASMSGDDCMMSCRDISEIPPACLGARVTESKLMSDVDSAEPSATQPTLVPVPYFGMLTL